MDEDETIKEVMGSIIIATLGTFLIDHLLQMMVTEFIKIGAAIVDKM